MEAEKLVGGRVVADSTASARAGLWMVRNGTATGTADLPVASTWFEVRARGDQCVGAPLMTVRVDGRTVATTSVAATTWTTYGWSGTWGAGRHAVSIGFSNDRMTAACDRNLRVDYVAMRSSVKPLTPASATNPFANRAFYVDHNAPAAVRAAALQTAGDTAGAALLGKIAGQPAASWFTDAVPAAGLTAAVGQRVDAATAAGSLPVLVAYAIPDRDCGGHSAGGVTTTAQYADWIGKFAAGIGSRRAVVVLEPDSIALWDCLSDAARADRITNLKTAINALTASGSVAVYLDGGHSNWQPVATMAQRLRLFDLSKVRGFATNVANFNPLSNEVAYGDALAADLGVHYVVDTSRNGAGPAPDYCNPANQALGARPSAGTNSTRADAWFWIKRPGESDGACNGGPSAGAWFESYALGLASRASW